MSRPEIRNNSGGSDHTPRPPQKATHPMATAARLRPVPTYDATALPTFLEPEQLAEMFKVPLETVYQWRRKRTGPPGFRVGRHLRYDLAAVLVWVAEQTHDIGAA